MQGASPPVHGGNYLATDALYLPPYRSIRITTFQNVLYKKYQNKNDHDLLIQHKILF